MKSLADLIDSLNESSEDEGGSIEDERAAMKRQLAEAQRDLHRRVFGGAIPHDE